MEKKPELVARFLHRDDDDHHATSVHLKTNRQLEEENTCPAMLLHVNPIRAENTKGHWRVIVQDLKGVHQRERIIMWNPVVERLITNSAILADAVSSCVVVDYWPTIRAIRNEEFLLTHSISHQLVPATPLPFFVEC